MIPVELDEVAGVKRPDGVAQIDHRGNAVLAGHDRAVREGSADVARKPSDRGEARRPSDVDDRHDQNLVRLNLARFGQRLRDTRASADDAEAHGITVEDAVAIWKRRIDRVGIAGAVALTKDKLHLVRQHLAPRERSLGES